MFKHNYILQFNDYLKKALFLSQLSNLIYDDNLFEKNDELIQIDEVTSNINSKMMPNSNIILKFNKIIITNPMININNNEHYQFEVYLFNRNDTQAFLLLIFNDLNKKTIPVDIIL